MLQVIIADITQGRSGNYIIGSSDLFVEVYGQIHADFGVFNLLIKFRHLFFGVSQRVIGDGEELRMFPDALDVPGRCFFTVSEALLNEICRIF